MVVKEWIIGFIIKRSISLNQFNSTNTAMIPDTAMIEDIASALFTMRVAILDKHVLPPF